MVDKYVKSEHKSGEAGALLGAVRFGVMDQEFFYNNVAGHPAMSNCGLVDEVNKYFSAAQRSRGKKITQKCKNC